MPTRVRRSPRCAGCRRGAGRPSTLDRDRPAGEGRAVHRQGGSRGGGATAEPYGARSAIRAAMPPEPVPIVPGTRGPYVRPRSPANLICPGRSHSVRGRPRPGDPPRRPCCGALRRLPCRPRPDRVRCSGPVGGPTGRAPVAREARWTGDPEGRLSDAACCRAARPPDRRPDRAPGVDGPAVRPLRGGGRVPKGLAPEPAEIVAAVTAFMPRTAYATRDSNRGTCRYHRRRPRCQGAAPLPPVRAPPTARRRPAAPPAIAGRGTQGAVRHPGCLRATRSGAGCDRPARQRRRTH